MSAALLREAAAALMFARDELQEARSFIHVETRHYPTVDHLGSVLDEIDTAIARLAPTAADQTAAALAVANAHAQETLAQVEGRRP